MEEEEEEEEEKQKLYSYLYSYDPEIVCLYLNIIQNKYGNELIDRYVNISKSLGTKNFIISKINKNTYIFEKTKEIWKLIT